MAQHFERIFQKVERDVIIKKRPGNNVKLIETSEYDKNLEDRNLAVKSLKIAINRAQKNFKCSPSTITMCG